MNQPLVYPPERSRWGHKGTFGTVLGIGGSRGMAGSVAMAGKAALLAGAGLCRLAVPDPVLETAAGFYPELTTIPCPADDAGRFHLAAADMLMEQSRHADALFFGPGLGRSEAVTHLTAAFLQRNNAMVKPIVMDADGLNALAAIGEWSGSGKNMILTPHAGEFERLRGEPTPPEDEPEQRQRAAAEFARRYQVLLVLKGHRTIITDGEQSAINTTGNPGMATGGSGDVLTGIIAGLLAQNYAPLFETVRLAVFLHGFAGDIAARHTGEISLTAADILAAIPNAFQQQCRSVSCTP